MKPERQKLKEQLLSEKYKDFHDLWNHEQSEDMMRQQDILEETTQIDQSIIMEDLKRMSNLAGQRRNEQDKYYVKREARSVLRKSGGVKKESVLWDDDD